MTATRIMSSTTPSAAESLKREIMSMWPQKMAGRLLRKLTAFGIQKSKSRE